MLTAEELIRVHEALREIELAQRCLEVAHDKLNHLFLFNAELKDVERAYQATRTARRFIERRLVAMDQEVAKCSTQRESGS